MTAALVWAVPYADPYTCSLNQGLSGSTCWCLSLNCTSVPTLWGAVSVLTLLHLIVLLHSLLFQLKFLCLLCSAFLLESPHFLLVMHILSLLACQCYVLQTAVPPRPPSILVSFCSPPCREVAGHSAGASILPFPYFLCYLPWNAE